MYEHSHCTFNFIAQHLIYSFDSLSAPSTTLAIITYTQGHSTSLLIQAPQVVTREQVSELPGGGGCGGTSEIHYYLFVEESDRR